MPKDRRHTAGLTAKYLLSSKGKNLLVCDDFIFRRKSRLGNRSYCICAYDRGFKCRARLCVLDGSVPPEIFAKSGEHNHARDYDRIKAREVVNTMKQMALKTSDSIDQIYSNCISNDELTKDGLVAMSSKAAVKAAMRRMRTRRTQSKEDAVDKNRSYHLDNGVDAELNINLQQSRRRRRKSTPVKVTSVIQETTDEDLTDLFNPAKLLNYSESGKRSIVNGSNSKIPHHGKNTESDVVDAVKQASSNRRSIPAEGSNRTS